MNNAAQTGQTLLDVPLGEISEITMGQSPDSANLNTRENGLSFLQGCAEFGRQSPQTAVYCNPPLRTSKPESILISVRAPVGTLNWGEQSYCIGRGLAAIRATKGVSDTRFLFYVISENVNYLHRRSQGSTFLAVGGEDLKSLPVPSFRIEAQHKIATILETIDEAIENTQALVDKYQQIKSGLMHDLLTRGIGSDGQLRPSREQAPELYQETPIGWIPKEWCYELLDKLAVRGSGHTPSKSHPEYWNGGIKWLSLADSPKLDNLYVSDTDFEISDKGIQNSSAVLHPPGIVVLSRDAGIGKSAITRSPMAVSQHFMCWKVGPLMDNHFLYYWLQNNKRMFENIAMGSTILTIGLAYFKRLCIACPKKINEQRSIAEKLKSLDIKLFALKEDLHKKRQQKSGLMHDLLTGKVPVPLESEEERSVETV